MFRFRGWENSARRGGKKWYAKKVFFHASFFSCFYNKITCIYVCLTAVHKRPESPAYNRIRVRRKKKGKKINKRRAKNIDNFQSSSPMLFFSVRSLVLSCFFFVLFQRQFNEITFHQQCWFFTFSFLFMFLFVSISNFSTNALNGITMISLNIYKYK